jgi:hypothetical protein
MNSADVVRNEDFYRELLALSKVPEQLHGGLVRYFVHGIPPGSFVRSVLENDCVAAVRRADALCQAGLGDLVRFLVTAAPAPAWGSAESVAAWIEQHRIERERVAS